MEQRPADGADPGENALATAQHVRAAAEEMCDAARAAQQDPTVVTLTVLEERADRLKQVTETYAAVTETYLAARRGER